MAWAAVRQRFRPAPPGEETKRRGDEARQLAWRLWLTRAPCLCLVAPGYAGPTGAPTTAGAASDPVAARGRHPGVGAAAGDPAATATVGVRGDADISFRMLAQAGLRCAGRRR
jgi:hypothetical protein